MSGVCDCPRCGSELVQPLRCVADGRDSVLVDLRCPECEQWRQGSLTRAQAAALDRSQAAARQRLVDVHDRLVAENMEALALCLSVALDRDLVGADDFDPRRTALAARTRIPDAA